MPESRKNDDKIRLFESMPIPKAVMTLVIPTILSNLIMVLYNLADTFFVSMLNQPLENAGVTLAGPLLLAFNAINNLFGVGASSVMSRALGAHDYETVRKSSAMGFYCALFASLMFSLLFTIFQGPVLSLLGATDETAAPTARYLFWTATCGAAPAILNVVMSFLVRSEGASLHASIGTMSGCLLNTILDPLFILPWGLNMGSAGAGLATFISNCVACLYFIILVRVKRERTFVCISFKAFHFEKDIFKNICIVGVPASIQNLLNVTGMTILNNIVAASGAAAVAAMGIAQKITSIFTQIGMGISQGVMPLVSYNFSSRNGERMRGAVVYTAKISQTFLWTATILTLIFPAQMIGAFMNQEAIVAHGTHYLRALMLAKPFLCIDFLAVGVFQACGMGHRALLFAIVRKLVMEIPAMYLFNSLYPYYGVAYGQAITEIVLAVLAVYYLRKIFRSVSETPSKVQPQ